MVPIGTVLGTESNEVLRVSKKRPMFALLAKAHIASKTPTAVATTSSASRFPSTRPVLSAHTCAATASAIFRIVDWTIGRSLARRIVDSFSFSICVTSCEHTTRHCPGCTEAGNFSPVNLESPVGPVGPLSIPIKSVASLGSFGPSVLLAPSSIPSIERTNAARSAAEIAHTNATPDFISSSIALTTARTVWREALEAL
jgi:hypothetical protein